MVVRKRKDKDISLPDETLQEYNVTMKPKRKSRKKKVNVIDKPVIEPRPNSIDRVPNLNWVQEVTVNAYPIGMRGYKYGLTSSVPVDPVWSKKMSGLDAMSFLRDIKTKNKSGRLESRSLPVE